ncbi:DUF4829 domain-containing protein [bacterium 210820-DFI.6.37]|nr:DUF4829 domain-containing protein [bacterium 210820-DFI.6.37]
MRKRIFLAGLTLCVLAALAGCGSGQEADKTAEMTVREYFAYWANQDAVSMNRLVIEEQQMEEDDPDVTLAVSLTLNSCQEAERETGEEWDQELYPDPYDFAYVDVDFDIAFEGGEGSGYSDGNYQTRFYLIKETKHSEWKIVTWGLG